jgi:Carboxypeptidase regulatory-like domain
MRQVKRRIRDFTPKPSLRQRTQPGSLASKANRSRKTEECHKLSSDRVDVNRAKHKPSIARMVRIMLFMFRVPLRSVRLFLRGLVLGEFALVFAAVSVIAALPCSGVIRDASGKSIAGATVTLHMTSASREINATTGGSGEFTFADVPAGTYELTVKVAGRVWKLAKPLTVSATAPMHLRLQLSTSRDEIALIADPADAANREGTGGEHLSSTEVSGLPLNERDFSKLLLLAAGTMTDTNGAANFTQQFSINGQRGVASVFAMDGTDTTDPELGGATFSNFNVEAIQEVQSVSGVLPSEIGHGAAGFTNVVTKSGTAQIHGSAFEFIRNAAFDARNFFDRPNAIDNRRIPPFVRNEFGVTNGGPLVLPRIYNGRGKTFYFGQYQGFRQVLGTTQVFPVPTAAERQGIDTTTFPGDTLMVPVNPAIAPVLARYPLPNEPSGPYGARTYATSSKVVTQTDQFSIRVDHRISEKATLLTRFSLNQVNGPVTNPDQTAIDPSFAIKFFDHQRSATVKYSQTISPRLSFTAAWGYVRSTPIFPAINHTQPAIGFGDGLFQTFNSADGSIFGSYGNLYQFKHDMTYARGAHAFKWGAEIRANRDTTIFGTNPNGQYTFGGGTAYSQVFIPSASGVHDIHPGAPLPDSLTGLLTATPYLYTISAIGSLTPGGDKFDEAAVRREAYEFYFQDAWKLAPRLSLNYGLRYEVNTRIKEAKHRTSIARAVDARGNPVPFLTPGSQEIYAYNPQPAYPMDWGGWGPRLSLDYAVPKGTTLHAGGAITTILPNLWQDNFVTGAFPFVFSPVVTALPGVPVAFQDALVRLTLPAPYTTQGQLLFTSGSSADLPANTPIDVQRFQNDLAAITPGHEVQLFSTGVMATNFRNGYIGTYTAGLDHDFGSVKFSSAYVGTTGAHLASVFSPNSYNGAAPAFAPYTRFDAAGRAIGGYGPEAIMANGSHSSYHALQATIGENSSRIGLSFQASYTFSKSIDDTSAVLGGFTSSGSVILQTFPQNPWNAEADKGPSTFDVTHVFTLNVFQSLPFERAGFLHAVSRRITGGWELLNITTLTSGSPFSVYSGVQQTGAGSGGTDRPDLLAMPNFSTSRAIREDYFGRGANNTSYFLIPIGVPQGTGPNQGRFGTLGRDTFRGPHFRNFDVALIKDTPFGRRGNGEFGVLQFRAELFNIFNIVNFGLPSNIVRGTGFGIVSKTAGSSRQIQFSLKLNY